MKSKIIVISSILALLIVWMVHYPSLDRLETALNLLNGPPIRQVLSAVKYSLDSGDTITDVNNPTFTGTTQIGKSGTAGYLYLYPTDTAGGTNEGTLYLDDSENLLKYYNGTSWLTVGIDYAQQSLVEWDNAETGDQTGEESSWTNTATNVWQDQRTGLYWSNSRGQYSNIFPDQTHTACPFFSTTPRGSYDGLDADCGNAINACGTLSLDANGGDAETDWYLPSEAELLQAYIDGMYNQAGSSFTTTNYFTVSTEVSYNSARAWSLGLNYNYAYALLKTTATTYVRCVRRD